jgi:hypothetical protein
MRIHAKKLGPRLESARPELADLKFYDRSNDRPKLVGPVLRRNVNHCRGERASCELTLDLHRLRGCQRGKEGGRRHVGFTGPEVRGAGRDDMDGGACEFKAIELRDRLQSESSLG